MTDIIRKFANPDGLVVDCCDGMFSIIKANTLLPRHTQFVRFDQDLECVASSHSQLYLILACQVVSEESDSTKFVDVYLAVSTFVKAMKFQEFKRRNCLWETSVDFPVMETFLLHILYHQHTYYKKYALYDQAKNFQSIFGLFIDIWD